MSERLNQAEKLAEKGEAYAEKLGNLLVEGFQTTALFVIGATIVWSAVVAYLGLLEKKAATVEDILLLFIFLELGAMVGIYFKTNRLPVQFLLYVAITVMTRSLASSLSVHDMSETRLLVFTGAVLILAMAAFVLQYTTHRLTPFVSHVESDYPTDRQAETERGETAHRRGT
jgi:phosphate starvation-inducible membrane PsiE